MYQVCSVLYILTILNHFVLNNVEARLHAEGIIGGTEANAGQIQYQVSFQVHGENICGGGIIDDNHILSAAHCFLDEFGEFRNIPLKVLAGTNKVNEKNERITVDVEKIFVPASYDPFIKPHAADIAVVKLKKSLNVNSDSRLKKLNLPNAKKSYSGEEAVVSGFGWDWVDIYEDDFTGSFEEVGGASKDVLKYAQTDVLSNSQCQQNYERRIRDTEICARMRQRDRKNHEGVCSGDSGGPLVFNDNTVIGVVSTSPLGCDESMDPGVYTRISSYLKFIINALNGIKARDMRVYDLSFAPCMDC